MFINNHNDLNLFMNLNLLMLHWMSFTTSSIKWNKKCVAIKRHHLDFSRGISDQTFEASFQFLPFLKFISDALHTFQLSLKQFLTSWCDGPDVLHGEHWQTLLRVDPDDPVGQTLHGQDASAWRLTAVLHGPEHNTDVEHCSPSFNAF